MKKRTPNGHSLTAVILEVFRLNGALLDAGNEITKPYGLTSARWQVMGAIDLAGQPMTVAQIARRMGLSRQGVQRIVNDLMKIGLVKAKSNIDHKRSPLISISDEGEKAMQKVNQAQIVWVNQLSKGLKKQDINQSLELLETIRTRLESKQD